TINNILRRPRSLVSGPQPLLLRLRRWPTVSIIILAVLFIVGIFGPPIKAGFLEYSGFAPYGYAEGTAKDRTIPPFWGRERVKMKTVVQSVNQLRQEATHQISLRDARKIKPAAQLGDQVPVVLRQRGSSAHWLGTDEVGWDIFSRLIHAARVTLLVAAISLISGLVVGTGLGLIAGYADQISPRFGHHLDEVVMRVVDIWLGLPFIIVALAVVIVFGQSLVVLLALLALLAWTPFVRNVRAEVLSLKKQEYVALAKVAGAGSYRILMVHILPGVTNTVVVLATLRVGQLIIAEAILSFLGAGVPPPKPSWGAMIADGRGYLADAWWIAFFPGVAIFLVVMALNFLGDWMRDRLDPRLRQL
ncbi:MAG: ABC transporter permease subunit, partial [Dehalococcoidia bacterium]